MIASGRLVGPCRLALAISAITALFACSGGGGEGGGSGTTATDLHLSSSSVSFSAFAGEFASETKTIQISWSNPRVAGIAVATLPGQSLPAWLGVSAPSPSASPVNLHLTRTAIGNSPGLSSTTLRIVSGDINLNIIETVDLTVSMDVAPMPTVSPNSVNLSWVESEQPTSRQLTVTRDSRVQLVGSVADVSWLDVSSVADTLTLAGNAQSQAQAPGGLGGNVTATFSFNGRTRPVTVPVTATVTKALSGPGQVAPEVNASTLDTDLNLSTTVAATTQAAVQFNASSNVPWLTVGNGTTGSPNNLALSLQSSQLSAMANGTYTGTVTIATAAPNISSLQIPVSLNLRLPEVHFVAPVAFSDTVDKDTVIVRGQGFNDPNAVLKLDGTTVGSPTLVNDTEIRFVPGARTAGTYEVKVPNGLNFSRGTASLRVIDPPAYANFSMDAAVGLQETVVSSPVNAMVFSQKCHFCTVTPAGTPSTVQRFTYDSGTTQWTRTEHFYTNLFDIALSPDESTLLVLTATQLLLVDPQTMTTTKTVTLPATVSGISRQLAVMNNGLVIIHALGKAYSLRADSFVPIAGLISTGGISASRDGSRAIFGEPINPPSSEAYRYYDASTGSVVVSTTFEHYSRGAYTRHAERALVNNLLVDANLAVLGSLPIFSSGADLRADGNRAYGLDFSVSPSPLRIFDLSGASPFVELAPVALGITTAARVAADPRGNAVFVISEGKFFVVDVR
ncbi:MAG: IPT/TIG domain-containing protein [Burkholderiales bacterium]